jgi:hypothetical protein
MNLTAREKDVLELIRLDMNLAQIAKHLKVSKPRVSIIVRGLEEKEMVRLKTWSARKFYELTGGAELLLGVAVEGVNSLSKPLYRFHNLEVVLPIVRSPEGFEGTLLNKGFEVAARRNYRRFQRRFNHGLVFFGKSVLYYPNEVWAGSPEECLNKLVKQAQEVRIELEDAFEGLRVGYPLEKEAFKLVNQHMALVGGAADSLPPHSLARGSRFLVDASKGVPEIEAHSPVYAQVDMKKLVSFFDDIAKSEILRPSEAFEWKSQAERILEDTSLVLASHAERLKSLERLK